MTLAELKRRLAVGTRVSLVERAVGVQVTAPEPREVVAANSKRVIFRDHGGNEIDFPFPYSNAVAATPDGFAINDMSGNVRIRYIWGWPNTTK